MKINIRFWRKNTPVQAGNGTALVALAICQIVALYLLTSHPSANTAAIVAKGIVLVALPFMATFVASKMAAYAIHQLQIKLVENLALATTNDIEQLHPHTFSKAATLDIDYLFQFWRELFVNVGFNLPILIYLTGSLLVQGFAVETFAILLFILVLSGLIFLVNQLTKTKHREHHRTYIDLQEQIRNYVENNFQFRLYRGEKKYLQKLLDTFKHFSKLTATLSQYRQLFSTVTSAVILLVFWGGLWLMKNYLSTSPKDIAILTFVLLEIRRIGTALWTTTNNYNHAEEIVKRLSQWLHTEEQNAHAEGRPIPVETIASRGLSFTYKNSNQAIDYPDFDIQAGEKVWFKGPNGKGKSTLWKILTGLYTGTDTSILLNKQKRQGDGVNPFWQKVSAVTEPAFCYSGTVWQIIGNFSYPKEEVENWLSTNDLLHLFDSYPNKLDTYHNSAFNNLSAGQLKWLLLVQALFLQPDILILDEPFSSLDVDRQQVTVRLINELPAATTLIVVSHHDLPILFDKIINL